MALATSDGNWHTSHVTSQPSTYKYTFALIFVLLLAAMSYYLFDPGSRLIQFAIRIGGTSSYVKVLDITTILLLAVWALESVGGASSIALRTPLGKTVLLFILALGLLPVVMGFSHGNGVATIFRDWRVVPYYLIALPIADSLTPERLRRLLLATPWMTLPFAAFEAWNRLYGQPLSTEFQIIELTSGTYYRNYGLPSAWVFMALSIFIIESDCALHSLGKKRRPLLRAIEVVFVALLLVDMSRALWLAALTGLAVVALYLVRRGYLQYVFTHAYFLILASIILIAIGALENSPVTERFLSIFDPGASTYQARVNITDRLAMITGFQEDTRNVWLGDGYGDRTSAASQVLFDITSKYHHSLPGYILLKLGVFGAFPVLVLMARLGYQAYRVSARCRDPRMLGMILPLLALLAYDLVLGFAENQLLDFRGYGIVPVALALGAIARFQHIFRQEDKS
jgi:hypothetical protein